MTCKWVNNEYILFLNLQNLLLLHDFESNEIDVICLFFFLFIFD